MTTYNAYGKLNMGDQRKAFFRNGNNKTVSQNIFSEELI
jgi:hypothetical protein|tara:strand:+ start:4454 stop:4570 length:117 start_codon:yes stop_codon:yes gene_type:complete